MLLAKSISPCCLRLCGGSVRYVSGYKINADNRPQSKHPDNLTDEDLYREKIRVSVLKKARTHMHGFDKIDHRDIAKHAKGPNPNEPYFNKPDLPVYRSIRRYWKCAERERRRQRKECVWWKTLDYWIREQNTNGEMVNIGFQPPKMRKTKNKGRGKKDPELEKRSRERTLSVDLEAVTQEWEESVSGSKHIHQIAHHYNIYKDLFGCGEFFSVVHMEVGYNLDDDNVNPVYYGNELLPSEVESAPTVFHKGAPDKLYTLLLTNPDEHLQDNNREYVHWLVGNIPGNDMTAGETLVDYLRPFPARGTGFQRMVFVLFQQTERIDYSAQRRHTPCLHLCDRDFKTFEFYKQFEEALIPASLRFFQCKWDYSVQNTYHNILKMQEPVYEYAKLYEKPRLGALKRIPKGKTLEWLLKFYPKEPTYPDSSPEEKRVRREAAIYASSANHRPNRALYPHRSIC